MIAAFFDIDGTIYRNALLIEHFKKMIKYELFDDVHYKLKVEEAYHLWDIRKGDYDNYLLDLIELYKKAINGLSEQYNNFISDQVVSLKGNRVYSYTREMIKWHKEQGHKVIFISGSPSFLVSRMAEKFGADEYCGSIYEIDFENKKYTGNIIKPMWDSVHKKEAIEQFIKKYDIDMGKSFAYGDTNGDLNMLSSVGNPRAINPSKELLKNIKKNNILSEKIEIIVERKDVIYKIEPNVQTIEF